MIARYGLKSCRAPRLTPLEEQAVKSKYDMSVTYLKIGLPHHMKRDLVSMPAKPLDSARLRQQVKSHLLPKMRPETSGYSYPEARLNMARVMPPITAY